MKLRGPLYFDTGPRWQTGTGAPEGVVTAPVGSMYSRLDGGADTAVYRKETGTGNTGWVPIADVYVSTTAPPGTPNLGDEWFNPTGGTTLILPLPVASGGTAATNAPAARSNLGLRAGGDSTTTPGAPTTGTWVRGDTWLDSLNVLWVCTVAGTPGTWTSTNRSEELAYNQITASVTLSSNAAASPNLVIEGTTRSYDGSTIMFECSAILACPNVTGAAAFLSLWDGGTDLGIIAEAYNGAGNLNYAVTVNGKRRLTPTPGSHNYRLTGWCNTGTGNVFTSPGGAGLNQLPAFIRVTRA